MSIYIDAEGLKAEFPHNEDWNYPVNTNSYVVGMIDEAPYIDLVKCKECNAYMTDGYADGCGFCAYHQSVVQADDFCSYGEREGE